MIRSCTVAELEAAPNLAEVLAEYAHESSLPELGQPQAQVETYRALESAGVFHPIGAFDGDRLIGFILPLVAPLPHYGVVAGVVESFFVSTADRKRGVGLKLLGATEGLARAAGAKALLVSAPSGGSLSRVLPHRGYRHSNEVFVRAL